MRLLVRFNAHRLLGESGRELASAPDTPGRETWRWQLRLNAPDETPEGSVTSWVNLPQESGPDAGLELSVEPGTVVGRLETVQVSAEPTVMTRDERELVALVVGRGRVFIEGRHRLDPLDLMVLEGDDPLRFSVACRAGQQARLALARVAYRDGTRVAWVP